MSVMIAPKDDPASDMTEPTVTQTRARLEI